MSTIIGHSLAGAGIAYASQIFSSEGKQTLKRKTRKPARTEAVYRTLFLIFVATLPDVDVPFGLALGQTIFSMHRQVTHTIPFALFVSLTVYLVFRFLFKDKDAARWGRLTLIALLSHYFLDYTLKPLYEYWDIAIFSGEERTIWGVIAPHFTANGLRLIWREVLLISPLFIIPWIYKKLKGVKTAR